MLFFMEYCDDSCTAFAAYRSLCCRDAPIVQSSIGCMSTECNWICNHRKDAHALLCRRSPSWVMGARILVIGITKATAPLKSEVQDVTSIVLLCRAILRTGSSWRAALTMRLAMTMPDTTWTTR